jgi:hypothetical protein
MATKTITAKIQVGASNDPESKRVDRNLLNLVKRKTVEGGGWSKKDTDHLVRSGTLNDKSPAIFGPSDEYANKSEGNVLRPMLAKARDLRKKVVLDGTEFKFTSAGSRDHFVSEMGRWYKKNAAPAKGGAEQVGGVGDAGQISGQVSGQSSQSVSSQQS